MRAFRLPLLAVIAVGAWQGETREVELTYLANEGFLLRAGETKVLIDAFVSEPYSMYAALPEELFATMVDGTAPFDGVDLALASHVHGDHFQPAAASLYLTTREETPFLSSPQVVERLELAQDARIRSFLPEDGKVLGVEQNGVQVELLRLPHAGGPARKNVQNLGHLIELGGVRLLHVGDAEIRTAELAGYELPERSIDVALVPYWWLGSREELNLVQERLGARRLVAMHVPPAELAEVQAHLAELDPEIVCFERAGQSRTLRFED